MLLILVHYTPFKINVKLLTFNLFGCIMDTESYRLKFNKGGAGWHKTGLEER